MKKFNCIGLDYTTSDSKRSEFLTKFIYRIFCSHHFCNIKPLTKFLTTPFQLVIIVFAFTHFSFTFSYISISTFLLCSFFFCNILSYLNICHFSFEITTKNVSSSVHTNILFFLCTMFYFCFLFKFFSCYFYFVPFFCFNFFILFTCHVKYYVVYYSHQVFDNTCLT